MNDDTVKDGAAFEADVTAHLADAGFDAALSDDERALVALRAGEGAPAAVVALELEAARPHGGPRVNSMGPVDIEQPTGYGGLD